MYFVEKSKGINFVKQFDYLMLGSVLTLSLVGLLVLFSATRTVEGGDSVFIKQAVFLVVGIIIAFVISAVDYKDFKILGIPLYIASVGLLVYVYFKGTGKQQWGSNSWMEIMGFSFQPSEIAKIAFIIIAAIFLERIKDGQDLSKNIIKLMVYSAIPIGLVLIQPDYGTAMVFIFAFLVMVFVCGLPYRYILGVFFASIPAGLFTWFFLLNEKRKNRIRIFFNPGADPQDSGYQILRSIRAIGSGQLYGKGLFRGVLNRRNAVPVKVSDFIFTVIGEELGFVGSAAIVLLIFIILMRCLYIAKNSRDAFGSFLVIGITAMMGFHFIENIGMNIGILPITGIPLPFVSAGGSALLTNYIAIGIILSVSMRRKRTIFNSST